MSMRTTLRPHAVVTDGDMSDDITSQPTVLQSLSMISYSYRWTGTSPVGAVSVEVSNEYAIGPSGEVINQGSDWTTVPIMLSDGSVALSAPLTGNTGTGFIEITTGAYAVRTVYTRDSGTGTLQVTAAGKVA